MYCVLVFYDEVLQTLQRASTEKISAENIILDINSLKLVLSVNQQPLWHLQLIFSLLPEKRCKIHALKFQVASDQAAKSLKVVYEFNNIYYFLWRFDSDCSRH